MPTTQAHSLCSDFEVATLLSHYTNYGNISLKSHTAGKFKCLSSEIKPMFPLGYLQPILLDIEGILGQIIPEECQTPLISNFDSRAPQQSC